MRWCAEYNPGSEPNTPEREEICRNLWTCYPAGAFRANCAVLWKCLEGPLFTVNNKNGLKQRGVIYPTRWLTIWCRWHRAWDLAIRCQFDDLQKTWPMSQDPTSDPSRRPRLDHGPWIFTINAIWWDQTEQTYIFSGRIISFLLYTSRLTVIFFLKIIPHDCYHYRW